MLKQHYSLFRNLYSLSLRKYNVHLDFKNHDGQRIFWIFKLYVKPAAFRDQTVRQFLKTRIFFAADDQTKVPLCIGQATLNIEDYVKLVPLYKIKINKYYLSCSRD